MGRHGRTPPPRAHWLLLGTLLTVITGLLLLHAAMAGALGNEGVAQVGSTARVPETARTGDPLIDPRRDPPVTLRPPDRTMALTFDDGPDPQWTPAILDVLDRYHVHARFFVTGVQAARNPGLVKEILARGHEVGHHTATHVDLRTAGSARTWLERRSTDLVLAYPAGVNTSLVRLPYLGTPEELDDAAWTAVRRLGDTGRLAVMSNVDSKDWRQPSVDAIVANSTPKDDRGVVLLMHDAGGDQSQTVAALDRLIPALQAKGWRFGPVSATVGAQNAATGANALDRIAGALLVGAVQAADLTTGALEFLLVAATILAALRLLMVLITSAIHVRRTRRTPRRPVRAPVTVIVPAYNEEAGIAATVRSALASRHQVEVIVVDDGSTDRTSEIVAALGNPRVRLICQANAGKTVALNTGLAAARTQLVVLVDGDTVLEPDTVGRLAAHFVDPKVGAVSGNAKVGNRRGLLGRWQHIEYVIGFNLDRRCSTCWPACRPCRARSARSAGTPCWTSAAWRPTPGRGHRPDHGP